MNNGAVRMSQLLDSDVYVRARALARKADYVIAQNSERRFSLMKIERTTYVGRDEEMVQIATAKPVEGWERRDFFAIQDEYVRRTREEGKE